MHMLKYLSTNQECFCIYPVMNGTSLPHLFSFTFGWQCFLLSFFFVCFVSFRMYESHILKSAYFNLALSFIHCRSMHLSYNFSQTKQITPHAVILSPPPFLFCASCILCPSIEKDLLIVLTQYCVSGILACSKNQCPSRIHGTPHSVVGLTILIIMNVQAIIVPFSKLCCLLLFKLWTVVLVPVCFICCFRLP